MGPVKGNWLGSVMQSTTGPVKQVNQICQKSGPVSKTGPGPNIRLKMIPVNEIEPKLNANNAAPVNKDCTGE